jgi:hypothetical protein
MKSNGKGKMRGISAMRCKQVRLTWWLIILFLALVPLPAHAADWSVVPQLDLGAKYDSNINFNFVGRQHDFIFNISPAVDLNYASEITKLTGRLALDGLAYVKYGNLDSINQYYRFSGQHQLTPRFNLTFTGGYTMDTTMTEELTSSGFVMNNSRRQALDAAPGLSFALTERASLQVGYAYNRVIYQNPSYTDYFTHSVNLGLNYLLKNAKTTLTGTLVGGYTNYPSIGNSLRNFGTYVGLKHKFSEDWSLAASGGVNYNWFSSQTAVLAFGNFVTFVGLRQVRLQTFTISPYVNIAATRRWIKTNLTFGYSINQSPSASGTINEFHSGSAGITHDFTKRLTGGLKGSVYYSTSSSPGSNYNDLVFYLSPNLSYKLTEKISVNSSYTYGWRENFTGPSNSLGGSQTTSRNLVWLYLRYSNPLHFQR